MRWWSEQYNKLDAKITDEIAFKIFQAGIWICLFIFILTNGISYFANQELASTFFWFSFDIALLCFAIPFRNKTWITESFFALAIYNLLDEIMGRGATMQYYEFPLAFLIILYTLIKHKNKSNGDNW